MNRPGARLALLLVIALAVIAAVSCKSNDSPPTESPDCNVSTPLSFPYIFSGNFTVDGEPGPQGIPMFARIGGCRGVYNNTVRPGEYTNVSISPRREEDIGTEVTFYLGDPAGPTVQAEETYVFLATTQPQLIKLDLTFPSLP